MNHPILLVEDNPSDVSLTIRVFQKSKLTNPIEVAIDGVAALDYLFTNFGSEYQNPLPLLVLLDIKLPKVDGLELLQRIRRDARSASLPVIVLTYSKEQEDLVSSYHLGVTSYIRKPVDFRKFADAVQRLGLCWLVLDQSPSQLG